MDITEVNILTIKNIDTEEFVVELDHKIWGILKPGEVKTFPEFLARHAIKHLIDQVMNHKDEPTNAESKRKQYEAQIIVDQNSFEPIRRKNEMEILEEQVNKLNNPLDDVLGNYKRASSEPNEPEEVAPELPPSVSPPMQQEEFFDKPDTPPEDVIVTQTNGGPTTQTVVTSDTTLGNETPVTRSMLYNVARDKGFRLDDPHVLASFEDMSMPELKNAVGYEG